MRLKDLVTFKEFARLPILEEVLITQDGDSFEVLEEGKWIDGRFDRNIRIDHPTHGVGQTHARVYGRKDKDSELGVVNVDGTGSHRTKMKLHKKDADALREAGVNVGSNNIIDVNRVARSTSTAVWVIFHTLAKAVVLAQVRLPNRTDETSVSLIQRQHLTGVLRVFVNGHKQKDIDQLLPWNFKG